LSRQCGILNISEPYRPPLSVTGIGLVFTFFTFAGRYIQEDGIIHNHRCENLKSYITYHNASSSDDLHSLECLLSCLAMRRPAGHVSLESLILLVQVTNCPIDMPHLQSVPQ
jgi:hypothetical protein